MVNRGKIIVIVAPSGTGKSTLINRLLPEIPSLQWSVSCTTRPIREGEIEGKDYFFLTKDEFEKKISQDAFIEWAKVHSNYYGTLKSFVDDGLATGKKLLFDLDVQGCDSVKKIYGDEARIIFIEPPSVDELKKRLQGRATDSQEVIQERLNNALKELQRKNDYDYNVINDDVEAAYIKLREIIKKELEN